MTDRTPDFPVAGASHVVRALRWLALGATVLFLVALIKMGHGFEDMSSSMMASMMAVMLLLLCAGATFLLSWCAPRNRALRAASPVLAVAGVAVFLTASPEAGVLRYFELHRAELDGLAWELRRERPFSGSLARSASFRGKERLASRLRELGAWNIWLEEDRIVIAYPLDFEMFHGFVQVPEGADPPRRGEAFFPEGGSMGYEKIVPFEGRWYYFLISDAATALPEHGEPSGEPDAASGTTRVAPDP